MEQFEIIADVRTEHGKGASRRLRRTGQVLAVLYGGGNDATSLKIDGLGLRKQLENEAFFSHILTVSVGGEKTQAVIKAMQRDPVSNDVVHLDLQRVSSTQEIHMNVPLHFINEETCPGRKAGGVISHLLVDVEVGCLPKDLPEYIEVDMGELDVGDSLHLSQLVLPEGVRLMAFAHETDHDPTLVTVQVPQKLDLDEPVEGEVVEGEEAPAEGAAPAEGESSED